MTAPLDRSALNGTPPDQGLFPLLQLADLLRMPDPAWLIEDLLPGNGLSVLYGAPKSCKSFLALDFAMSIATGSRWFTRAVRHRRVVYVAAEGVGGLKARAHAWWLTHGKPADEQLRIHFLPAAVDLRSREQIDRARRTLASLDEKPGLIVIDTMARTMPGGDENAARDVGEFIAAVDVLRESDAALVVHHTGKLGDDARGSSALRGAADLMALVKRDGHGPHLTLSCEDMKDAAEWEPIPLRLEPAGRSCVLSLHVETVEARDTLRDDVLQLIGDQGPISQNRIEKAIHRRKEDVRQAIKALADASLIERPGRGWQVRPSERDAPRTHPLPGLAEDVRPAGETETKSLPAGTHSEPTPCVPRPTPPDAAETDRAEQLLTDHADIARGDAS